jgi:Glycosyltransferase family 87
LTARRSDAHELPPLGPGRRLHLLAPAAAPLALIPVALSIRYTADFGLAYHGGVEAWASGHPERVFSWISTPFLALVMALITRLGTEEASAHVFLGANLVLWGGLLIAAWTRFQGRVPPAWWRGTLVAAAVFSPAISTIYWLSFNLVAFVLALAGFVLIGRHDRLAGLLIGASLALKPILLVVPLALLLRRESRPAALWSIAAAAGLSACGLGFLAWRAGAWSVLDPFAYLAAFAAKGHGPLFSCVVQNYSPVAFLCRLGVPNSTVVTVGLAAGVGLLGWLLLQRSRHSSGSLWELFALACLLSPMIGPVEWASYQLVFAPLMLLLAYQFWTARAPFRFWVYLAAAFLMTDLVWDPLESLAGAPVLVLVISYSAGQFVQYFLILIWVQWVRLGPAPASNMTARPAIINA